MQLFRQSIAARQKELIEISLRSLETYALTARSATNEEAQLRQRESALMMTFIERARAVQPKGQVVLLPAAQAGQTILEDGDLIRVPNRSNTVLVSGEVVFPSALVWEPSATAQTFIARAGGFTQLANEDRIVILRQDGSVAESRDRACAAGRRDHGAAQDHDQEHRDHARDHDDPVPDRVHGEDPVHRALSAGGCGRAAKPGQRRKRRRQRLRRRIARTARVSGGGAVSSQWVSSYSARSGVVNAPVVRLT